MKKTKQNPEIICAGQAVIDCLMRGVEEDPNGNGKTRAESVTLRPGGDAFNEAAVLTKCGHTVSLVCAVGEDPAGRLVVEEAERHGIDCRYVSVMPELVTPVAGMMVAADGSRSSISARAAMLPGYRPDAAVLDAVVPEEPASDAATNHARVLSLASLFRAPWDTEEAVIPFILEAKRRGLIICADTKLPTFRILKMEDLAAIWPCVDYIFPNESEASYYTGEQDPARAAESFLKWGVRHAVVKCGSQGICAASREERFSLPAIPVEAVDSTGAGDNFVGGFIHAMLTGADFRGSCEAGLARAADCLRRIGAV